MEKLRFESLNPTDDVQCECFRRMMYLYCGELGGMEELAGGMAVDDFIEKWIQSILKKLGPSDRHLEVCWLGDIPAGFLYGKVDHKEHRGFVRPGEGYVMEFYVEPQLRRRGIGTAMYRHLEKCFSDDGAKSVYLTTDTDGGISFWEHLGFVNCQEKSPDNQMEIYQKAIK